MSYYNVVLKDNPIGFWKLDESSGTTAYDSSGCGNNGTYVGFTTFEKIFPLVSGGLQSTKINNSQYVIVNIENDYTQELALGLFANKYCSDNDFSLEIWTHIKSLNSEIPIFVNDNNNIGIYYKNNTIYFYVEDQYVYYTPDNLNESLHIVATYEKDIIKLYINGEFVAVNYLTNYKFSNDPFTSMTIGPCSNSGESFIVDAPAIYRYALNYNDIKNHYNFFDSIRPIQIVQPDSGILFSGTDVECLKGFEFSYPLVRKWDQVLNNDVSYNLQDDYITLATGVSSATIYDNFLIPSGINFISSKIEWNSDNLINISVSEDGVTYTTCKNGYALPGWRVGEFSNSKKVYLKIDILGQNVKLKDIKIYFYVEKLIYADNFGDYISLEQPGGNLIDTSSWDFSAPSINYSVLKRNELAGIKPDLKAGFAINTDTQISTIEMIIKTPETILEGTIFSNDSAWLTWPSNKTINKSGISHIYINGIDKTSQTNIDNILNNDELHHLVLVLSSPISGKIYINSKVSGGIWSNSGGGYSYGNIAIYPTQLSSNKVTEHYDLYTKKAYSYSDPVSIGMTETEVKTYNNDWQVVKSV